MEMLLSLQSYLLYFLVSPIVTDSIRAETYLPATECFQPESFFSGCGGDVVDPGGVLEVEDSEVTKPPARILG